MTLKARRYLYLFFVLIFLTITPIISLYASGYKIGKDFKIEKTGIFIIDSEPNGAKIYINGKIQKSFLKKFFNPNESYVLTPAKLKNILPGKYDIKVEHTGYWDWGKKLEIKPGESTFAENITLFKKDLPILLVNGFFQNVLFSDNKKALLQGNEQITAFDLEKERIISKSNFATTSAAQNDLIWSSDEEKYILNNSLFRLDNNLKKYLAIKEFPVNAKNFQFDEKNSNLIFYQTENSIIRYATDNQEIQVIKENNNIEKFLVKDKYLFYIETNRISTSLNAWRLDLSEKTKQISIPSSEYAFINPGQKYINLYDQKHEILYLIDPFAPIKQLLETVNNINKSTWINDNKLLYANNFEIWTLNTETLKRTLITRIGDKIQKIVWHPNDNYILYSTDKSINVIELDDRDRYNSTKLFELNKINGLSLSENGEYIYFLGQIGKQEGLYKLSIQ